MATPLFFLIVACIMLKTLLTVPVARHVQLHDKAIQFANQGNYASSLANFRAAVRATNQSNPWYLSDLGVTEMRMGIFKLAARRFQKALELDPSLKIVEENMKELGKFIDIEAEMAKKSKPTHHREKPISIPASSFFQFDALYTIDPTLFGKGYNNPLDNVFVIEDLFSIWGLNLETFSTANIIEKYGNRNADYYPHNMKEEGVRPFFLSLKKALKQLTQPEEVFTKVDASEPGTYIQWNIDDTIWKTLMQDSNAFLPGFMNDSLWINRCMVEDSDKSKFFLRTHWKMLLIGEEGSGMFNHKDTLRTTSWQLQIQGRKKWHICGPSQDEFMYGAGEVDFFHPDYKNYPKAHNASCYEVILHPGQLLYYPADHWHQTINLDTPTVALSGTVPTASSHMLIREELVRECKGEERIMAKDARQCKLLKKCYKVWREIFADNSTYLVCDSGSNRTNCTADTVAAVDANMSSSHSSGSSISSNESSVNNSSSGDSSANRSSRVRSISRSSNSGSNTTGGGESAVMDGFNPITIPIPDAVSNSPSRNEAGNNGAKDVFSNGNCNGKGNGRGNGKGNGKGKGNNNGNGNGNGKPHLDQEMVNKALNSFRQKIQENDIKSVVVTKPGQTLDEAIRQIESCPAGGRCGNNLQFDLPSLHQSLPITFDLSKSDEIDLSMVKSPLQKQKLEELIKMEWAKIKAKDASSKKKGKGTNDKSSNQWKKQEKQAGSGGGMPNFVQDNFVDVEINGPPASQDFAYNGNIDYDDDEDESD